MDKLASYKLGLSFKLSHLLKKSNLVGICVPQSDVEFTVSALRDKEKICIDVAEDFLRYVEGLTKNSIKKMKDEGDKGYNAYIKPLQKGFINYMRKQHKKEKIYIVSNSVELLHYLNVKTKNISVFRVMNSDVMKKEDAQFMKFIKMPYSYFPYDGTQEELKTSLVLSSSKN
jgi:hypothetical protein